MKALDYLYRMKQRNDEMGMPAINIDEAIEEIKTLQQELKQGQDNYNKLWNMYSELKKEDKELKALLPTDIDTANVWTWKKRENK